MATRAPSLLALAALAVAGCAAAPDAGGAPAACDLAGFEAVRHAHVNRAEVTLCGTVVRVAPVRTTRSGTHRRFFIDTGRGRPIEIDANLDVLGNLPVAAGERATVRGEYYDDGAGRDGVHWTHHTGHGPHPAGFVTLDGRTYQ